MFGIYKGRGLLAARQKRGPLHAWVRKAHPDSEPVTNAERTQSERKADPERTQGGPRANPERTQNF
jgi:hypothetical protein